LSTGNIATLQADVDYDAAGATTLTVDSTAGWASSGLVHLGRETMTYGVKGGTTLSSITRGAYDFEPAGTTDSYGDCRYRHDNTIMKGPRVVSDFIRVWYGRWVSLRCHLVDQDGIALDSAFAGDYSREVWRGIIRGEPLPVGSWSQWALECESIDGILSTKVGPESRKGMLLRVPGSYAANTEGAAGDDDLATGAAGHFYIDDASNKLTVDLIEYTSAGNYPDTSNSDIQLTFTLTNGLYAVGALREHINALLEAGITGAGSTWGVAGANANLSISLGQLKPSQNVWSLNAHAWSSHVYDVKIRFSDENSVGKILGFTSDLVAKADSTHNWDSPMPAVSAYTSATAMVIPFFYREVEGQNPTSAPSAGYALIGEQEIVEYGSITELDDVTDGLWQLDIVKRGALGTVPEEHIIPAWWWSSDKADDIDVTFGVGFDAASPVDVILQLATSTGEGGHGNWDALADMISPPLNPLHFDTDAMESVSDQLVGEQGKVTLFMSKPTGLAEFAADMLGPYGMHLLARPTTGGLYRITIDELLPALESESVATVDSSDLDWSDPATLQNGQDRIVSGITVHYRWDVRAEEATDDVALILHHDIRHDYGEANTIEWTLVGRQYTVEQVISGEVRSWAQTVFRRHGRPYRVLQLEMSRRDGWLISSGDVIKLSLPDFPAPTGARGVTNRYARVLQVAYTYQPAEGSVSRAGASVVAVLEPYERTSTYSPAAKVSAYNAGGPTITLADNQYTSNGLDSDHFDNGDVVQIFNRGIRGTYDERTLSAKSTSTFTLSGALSSVTWGATTVMVPAAYADCQTSQKTHAFVADNSAPSVLSVADVESFKYV
jgi:hypothetical protein